MPVQLEQAKWAAAFPSVLDLLAQPGADAEVERRLRWLLAIADLALRDGNRAETERAVREAEPFLAGRESLATEFRKVEQRAKD